MYAHWDCTAKQARSELERHPYSRQKMRRGRSGCAPVLSPRRLSQVGPRTSTLDARRLIVNGYRHDTFHIKRKHGQLPGVWPCERDQREGHGHTRIYRTVELYALRVRIVADHRTKERRPMLQHPLDCAASE